MNAAAARPRPFPWTEIMGFAFGVLRLSPDAVWSMTPREINSALEALYGVAENTPARRDLDRLMERYPDKDSGYQAEKTSWKT